MGRAGLMDSTAVVVVVAARRRVVGWWGRWRVARKAEAAWMQSRRTRTRRRTRVDWGRRVGSDMVAMGA